LANGKEGSVDLWRLMTDADILWEAERKLFFGDARDLVRGSGGDLDSIGHRDFVYERIGVVDKVDGTV